MTHRSDAFHPRSTVAKFYTDAAEIEDIVRRFESCDLPPAEFDHRAHLMVALCYLRRMPFQEAHARTRINLKRFLDHHSVDPQQYNETMTLFWLKVVDRFLVASRESTPVEAMAEALLKSHDDSRLIYSHYSRELLTSDRARTAWVEPDLQPLNYSSVTGDEKELTHVSSSARGR